MSKYSKKFKLEVIKDYLKENQSYSKCCEIFSIQSETTIRTWINKYKMPEIKGDISVQKVLCKITKAKYDKYFACFF